MKCHSCGRDYADTATFCPFCGAKPARRAAPARPAATPRPAAPATSSNDFIEADQKTMALDIASLGLDDGAIPRPSGGGFQADPEPVDRTVSMQAPPGALNKPSAPPAGKKPPLRRSGTILGMPGMKPGAAPAAPSARPSKGSAALRAGLVPGGRGAASPPAPAREPEPEPELEATAAIDPASLGLTDPEPELEATAAIDPASLGLTDPEPAPAPAPAQTPGYGFGDDPEADEATAAIDPASLGLTDSAPAPASAPTPAPAPAPAPAQRTVSPLPAAQAATGKPAGGKTGGGKGLMVLLGVGIVAIAVAVVAVIMLLSGGGGGASMELAKTFVPASVDGVMGVNADAIRESWAYTKYKSQIEEAAQEARPLRALLKEGVLTLDGIHALAVGFKAPAEDTPPAFVAALGAELDADKAGAFLKEKVARGKEDRVHDLDGTTFYGKAKREVAGIVDGDTVFASSLDMAKKALAVRGGGDNYTANEDLVAVLGDVDGPALWFGAKLNKAMLGGLAEAGPAGEFLKPGDVVAVGVSLSGGVKLTLAAKLTEESRASEIETKISAGLGMAGMFLGSAGLTEDQQADAKEVIDSVSVSSSGATVKLSIEVSQELLEKYEGMATKML